MPRKTRRHRGGASYTLSGAPLDYNMRPGAFVETYGRFPVDVSADPQSITDLDVFFRSGMATNCGIENSSLVVPPTMGSNQIGGSARRQRKSKKSKRGGASSLSYHPYIASATPNVVQTASHAWNGGIESVPAPPDPVVSSRWNWQVDSSPLNKVFINESGTFNLPSLSLGSTGATTTTAQISAESGTAITAQPSGTAITAQPSGTAITAQPSAITAQPSAAITRQPSGTGTTTSGPSCTSLFRGGRRSTKRSKSHKMKKGRTTKRARRTRQSRLR